MCFCLCISQLLKECQYLQYDYRFALISLLYRFINFDVYTFRIIRFFKICFPVIRQKNHFTCLNFLREMLPINILSDNFFFQEL